MPAASNIDDLDRVGPVICQLATGKGISLSWQSNAYGGFYSVDYWNEQGVFCRGSADTPSAAFRAAEQWGRDNAAPAVAHA